MAAALPPETLLSEIVFTVLDTETTGVNLEHGHEIIELGMVRYSQGKISDTFSTLFRPTVPVSEPALSINRIGLAELAIGSSGRSERSNRSLSSSTTGAAAFILANPSSPAALTEVVSGVSPLVRK